MLGAGERVDLVGWSERPISARAWSPAAGAAEVAAAHDTGTGVWELAVDVGAAGWANVHLRT